MKNKDGLKGYIFIFTTILLMLLILFCSSETLMCQSRSADREQKQYYTDMEKKYLSDMEELLCDKGYEYSGITIRWISDAKGLRNYTIMIHHRRLESLNSREKAKLVHELSVTEFKDERCTFSYEFIDI